MITTHLAQHHSSATWHFLARALPVRRVAALGGADSYAHSIDFGAKGYGNLAELASLQHQVAGQLGRPAERMLLTVKSAHVYETERGYVQGVLAAEG